MTPVTLADGSKTNIPALPIQLGEWRPGTRRDLPGPGEHNDVVLKRPDPGPPAS
jgi:hypothetical protein